MDNLKSYDDTRWDLKDIIKVFLSYMLMMMVGIPVFLWILKQIFGFNLVSTFGQNTTLLSLSLIVNIITCLYIFRIVLTGYGLPITSLGLTVRNWQSDIKIGLRYYLIALPVIIASGIVVNYVLRTFGIEPEHQDIINSILDEDSLGVLIFMLLFGVLAAPVVEELLFRGFIQPAVRTIFGTLKAVLISGFVFALVHWNAQVFFQIFVLGILLAYLYEKTGSLVAPITVHVCHNTTTLVFLISCKHILENHA